MSDWREGIIKPCSHQDNIFRNKSQCQPRLSTQLPNLFYPKNVYGNNTNRIIQNHIFKVLPYRDCRFQNSIKRYTISLFHEQLGFALPLVSAILATDYHHSLPFFPMCIRRTIGTARGFGKRLRTWMSYVWNILDYRVYTWTSIYSRALV